MPSLDFTLIHEVPRRLRLRVPALRERLDAAALESWMDAATGVHQARVNRTAASLTLEYRGGATVRGALRDRLGAFAPHTLAPPDAAPEPEAELAPMLTNVLALATLPLLTPPWQRLLTVAAQGRTLAGGADSLIRRGIKVEVLDALAIGLAASRGQVYTANITGFMLALGEYLERRTERQSDRLLRRLLRPEPALAWVERDGALVQIAGDEVQAREIVVVGVGETIPVDRRVIDGVALVNQAAVTGEDVPVRKEAPRRVVAGSTLMEGRLRIEATQVGSDTTTARIARFIQESLAKQSDTQRLAERLADQRVYLTLVTGALVYAVTHDLTRLESVFLVDYSCALKLGTLIAFKSGMYAAASRGVLMKGGQAIEQLAAVDTVVFDKTGTLTHSELIVTDVAVLDAHGCSESELLALVASVEEHASHPVAKAVVDAARERDLQHITHGEVDYLVAHGLAVVGRERREQVSEMASGGKCRSAMTNSSKACCRGCHGDATTAVSGGRPRPTVPRSRACSARPCSAPSPSPWPRLPSAPWWVSSVEPGTRYMRRPSRQLLFSDSRALTTYRCFDRWAALMAFILKSFDQRTPQPKTA